MAWTRPRPEDYTPEPGLEDKLLRPRTGTIYFRVAQLDSGDVAELLKRKQAQEAIDAGRAPKKEGKIPLRLFDKVADYAEGYQYAVAGRIMDQATGFGVPGLTVELWVRQPDATGPIGAGTAKADGRFKIEIESPNINRPLPKKMRTVYLRILRETELLLDTRETLWWTLEPGTTELGKIEVSIGPSTVAHRLVGRLLEEESGRPLAGLGVHVLDLDAEPDHRDRGYAFSNSAGFFISSYETAESTEEDEPAGERSLRFEVSNRKGAEIYTVEISIQVGQKEAVEIRVPAGAIEPDFIRDIVKIEDLIGPNLIQPPAELQQFLADNEIETLGNILIKGGIRHVAGLPTPDHPAVSMLEGHAVLSLVRPDLPDTNPTQVHRTVLHPLVLAGYGSVSRIANTSRTRFVEVAEAQGDLNPLSSARMHATACAQHDVLGNILTDWQARLANGFEVPEIEDIPDIGYVAVCRCEDCESGVSPLAYLADLLSYVTNQEKVTDSGQPIDMSWLEDNFRQPFGSLPASCEQVSQTVSQVRIGIEVLRRLLDEPVPHRSSNYCLKAYQKLLEAIGTSYQEIRLARSAPDEDRRRLAVRVSTLR